MVGQERTIVPLLATDVFGITSASLGLAFVAAFGITKAVTNLAAGALADRQGRKPVLVAGWLVGLPVPFMLILAPDWGWVIAANVLLGINQGLTWSTTVLMKIDLVGPRRRGFALGLNEAAGYLAVAAMAFLTGLIADRTGLRPTPLFLGIAVAGLGLGISTLFVRETRGHVELERTATGRTGVLGWRAVAWRTSVSQPSLSAASAAGLANNLNDGLAWGLLPIVYAGAGLSFGEIGLLAAAYPATWGAAQLMTGALSDRAGRKPLIVGGLLVQAAALVAIAAWSGLGPWLVAAIALGLGTAMVYPALIAVVADVAEPAWRGAAVGVYRFWRDAGFAVGAIVAGSLADRFGAPVAIAGVAAITAAAGILVALRMRETRPTS
jgi:MFS family permease